MKDSVRSPKEENNKALKRIPWLLLALGFIFTVNPNVSIIDVLPDFIGYIIICTALGKLSMLSETIADAKRAFEKMIVVDAGKALAIVWIFGVGSVSERSSSLLLWSFVFGVLEAIFLIPCYLKLFKGLSDLGDYYPNSTIHTSKRTGVISHTDVMKIFSIVFIVVKAFMTVLPELADLTNFDSFETGAAVNLYRYIGIMRLLSCVPVVLVGIAWFIGMLVYFGKISKDSEFNSALLAHYQEHVLPKKGLFVIRYLKMATWFLIAAAVLSLDIIIDGINIFPDVLVVIPIIFAFVYMCRSSVLKKRSVYILLVLYGVLAIATSILNGYYLENFTYNAMSREFIAFAFYFAYVVVGAAKGIVFVLMLSSLFKQMQTVIKDHTGYVVGKEIESEGERRRIDEVHKEINKCFSVVIDVAIAYVISDSLYSLYGAIYAFLRREAGYLSLINLALGLLFIGMVVRAVDTLKEAVQTKYMLE